MEIWGRVLQKICEACDRQKNPRPEFKVFGGEMSVKFNSSEKGETEGDVAHDVAHRNRRETIAALVKSNPHMTRRELAKKIGVSIKTIERELKDMTNLKYDCKVI